MSIFFLAYVAGLVTLLNPCVLPLLPIIIGTALQENIKAPLALALGLSLSFTLFGLLILMFGFSLGIDQDNIRTMGAVLLLLMGIILLIPKLQQSFARLMTPFATSGNQLLAKVSGSGLTGQFMVGVLLGLVWSPCVGPTLGVAIAAASQGENILQSLMTFFIFSTGVSTALIIFAYGSRATLNRRKGSFQAMAKWAKPFLGIMLILVSMMILSGFDKILESLMVDSAPHWLIQLTTSF